MEEIRDYYAFLGVPRNATNDEIKRAYARKRREYQNDETKSTQLNQAYEVLCDSAKRKQYDLNIQYGNQVEDIKEKIRNSETLEQRDKHLVDAKKIYLDILNNDAENADALWNLVGIEELLGNDTQAILYLEQLEECVEGDDKLQVYHRLGDIYRKLGKIDEAIKCYYAIYKADAAYVEDIKMLVRLYYEDKKNLKEAIQVLNDCINRSADSRLKIVYLYETLRAIRLLKVSSYQKVEDTLYKKMETFRTENEESNLANAATILTCFEDVLDREDYECFHRLEKVYQSYGIEHTELNQGFIAVQQVVELMENGKVHKAIDLYLEEQWTKEIREQLGKLLITEAEQIKESLECIKKAAPEYWKSNTELADLEKIVNENLKISKEFNSLSNDRTISYYMKKMMECILLDGFVIFEDMKDEFIEARDSFFDKEDRGKFEHTLRKMEEYYPICYKLFADIFFDGKSTGELANSNNQSSYSTKTKQNVESKQLPYFPNAKEGYEHKPYIEGFLELLFIVIGTCCFPPALPMIFIIKYYARHQKTILKVGRRVLVVAILLLLVVGTYAVSSYIREKQYEESHDYIIANDISAQGYVENQQKQERLNAYSITQDGTYDVGYGKELIKPGSYKVKAGGDIDNQFSLVYITAYRNGRMSGQYTVGSFPISITLQDGDALDVSYSGRGDYHLDLQENESTSKKDEDDQINSDMEISSESTKEDDANENKWEIEMNMIFYAMATNCTLDELSEDIQVEPFDRYAYENGGSKGLFNAIAGDFTGVLHYSEVEEIGFYFETDEPIVENDVTEIFNIEPITNVIGNKQTFVWRDKVEIEVYYHSYCTALYFKLYSINADDYLSMSEEGQKGR